MMKRMVILVGALLAAPLLAQAPPPARTAPRPVTVSPAESDLRDILRSLASQSGERILIGTEVSGKLTVKLDNVPLATALAVVTKTTSTRLSRIIVPADKAEAITAEQAADLVAAADTLTTGALMVQPGDKPTVSVSTNGTAPPGAVTVYLVHTKTDPAAIKAARDEARKRTADKLYSAQEKAYAATLSPEAAKDPGLVKAYSAVQGLQPDQIAVLFREYMAHSTPQQLQSIGDAMQRQHVRMD